LSAGLPQRTLRASSANTAGRANNATQFSAALRAGISGCALRTCDTGKAGGTGRTNHRRALGARASSYALHAGGPLQHLLLRYTQALIAQMTQTAVCNRHHTVEQQLCRWLLLSLDRLPSNELAMTQELIANMLGVRREGVTEAAGHLQTAGLIHYSRGHITVLDRPKLEARVCECYAVVKKEMDCLLPDKAAS
jgi:hypothetical protein